PAQSRRSPPPSRSRVLSPHTRVALEDWRIVGVANPTRFTGVMLRAAPPPVQLRHARSADTHADSAEALAPRVLDALRGLLLARAWTEPDDERAEQALGLAAESSDAEFGARAAALLGARLTRDPNRVDEGIAWLELAVDQRAMRPRDQLATQ